MSFLTLKSLRGLSSRMNNTQYMNTYYPIRLLYYMIHYNLPKAIVSSNCDAPNCINLKLVVMHTFDFKRFKYCYPSPSHMKNIHADTHTDKTLSLSIIFLLLCWWALLQPASFVHCVPHKPARLLLLCCWNMFIMNLQGMCCRTRGARAEFSAEHLLSSESSFGLLDFELFRCLDIVIAVLLFIVTSKFVYESIYVRKIM